MADFVFSPTMMGKIIHIILKGSGVRVSGIVVECNPVELILKNEENQNLIHINREEVSAYTGYDDKKRVPEALKLYITRCCNPLIKCNGVKRMAEMPLTAVSYACCPICNESCVFNSLSFFDLTPQSQIKLFKNITIGEYPKDNKKGGEK